MKVDESHIIATNSVLYRHAVAKKYLASKTGKVLKIVVEYVNYVQNSALMHLIFKKLYNEVGSEF